jgi:hypothetical protein
LTQLLNSTVLLANQLILSLILLEPNVSPQPALPRQPAKKSIDQARVGTVNGQRRRRVERFAPGVSPGKPSKKDERRRARPERSRRVRHIPQRRIPNRIRFHVFPKRRYVPKASHARVLRRNIGTSITGQRHFTPGSSPELPKACSCYRRQSFLASARRRDYFLKVFEQVREKYDLVVWG